MLLDGTWNSGFECGITVAEFWVAGQVSKQFTCFHFSLEHSLGASPSFAPIMLLGILFTGIVNSISGRSRIL
jgi:hypothetical protein